MAPKESIPMAAKDDEGLGRRPRTDSKTPQTCSVIVKARGALPMGILMVLDKAVTQLPVEEIACGLGTSGAGGSTLRSILPVTVREKPSTTTTIFFSSSSLFVFRQVEKEIELEIEVAKDFLQFQHQMMKMNHQIHLHYLKKKLQSEKNDLMVNLKNPLDMKNQMKDH
jgi:ABC-type nitrate/sulfonate/bicarbonate transport system ATPase subunit